MKIVMQTMYKKQTNILFATADAMLLLMALNSWEFCETEFELAATELKLLVEDPTARLVLVCVFDILIK